ncbi:MAG: ABC transporter permease [Muribaculaceae bacterium]|nr:ABC transporter permease [Muribaculaceae bacterium]
MKQWLLEIYRVWWREFRLVLRDEGVVIFFFAVCAVYPILYSLIYNTEVERDEPIVVVDDCRTQLSRQLTRNIDATPEVMVVGMAANMQEARELMHRKKCYGIVYIPRDFSQRINSRQQGHVSVYSDMSVMFRYKNMLMAITNVTQAMGGEMMHHTVEPVMGNAPATIIESRQVPIGNTAMGLASAVLLFVLPLVIQQSMLLGIGMLHGGSIERRRKNRGYDPMEERASVSATIIGKMMCHQVVYVLPVIYVLYFTPMMFDFPLNAHLIDTLALAVPFIIAVSFMGQTLQAFVNERESVFMLFAFTSVFFIFFTGVSWPRYEMSRFWYTIGDCVPSTWMSNGYVLMQSGGASLSQIAHPFKMLWLQCGVFFVLAYAVEHFVSRPRYRQWQRKSEDDPEALLRNDLLKNGAD